MRGLFSLTAFVLLCVLAVGVSAQTTAGTITYMEGSVEISRNGEFLDPSTIDIGTSIQEFDTLQTADDGYVEVEMNAPEAGSVVKVRPGTAFYFESSAQGVSEKRTMFQLLRGSLSLKVGRLSNKESFGVQTDTAVMAVRGTEFNVDMSMDRSVLVTVPEGSVESRTDRKTIMARPGAIALIDMNASASSVSVAPDDIELYREYWSGLRKQALNINATLSVRQHAILWKRQLSRMESAMAELTSHDDVFRKWARIIRTGGDIPSTGESMRDKGTLSRGMLELRAALPTAERAFQALVGLEEAYEAGLVDGSVEIAGYRNAAAFYRDFQRDKIKMRRMLSASRTMVRIYRFIEMASGSTMGSGHGLMGGMPTL